MAITSLSRSNPGTKFSTATQQLQNDLISLGFSVGPTGADGKFGANTEQAVRNFQYTWGLTIDGIVGSQTAAAIKEAVGLLAQGQWNPQVDPSTYSGGTMPAIATTVAKPPVIQTPPTPTTMISSLTSMLPPGGLFGIDWKWIGLGAFGVMALWWMNRGREGR